MFRKAISTFALVATLAATASFAMPTNEAEAAGGRHKAFAFGAITGLAVGAIATHPRYHRHPYYGPYAHRHPHPRPVYYGRPAAWTPEWFSYCSARYRSFNPHTGYFRTYSGKLRFCR